MPRSIRFSGPCLVAGASARSPFVRDMSVPPLSLGDYQRLQNQSRFNSAQTRPWVACHSVRRLSGNSQRVLPKEIQCKSNPSYCVRSRQPNEISCFGRRPVPATFKTLEAAKQYRTELNLRRGAYHPWYFIERQENARNLLTTSIGEMMRLTVTSRIL